MKYYLLFLLIGSNLLLSQSLIHKRDVGLFESSSAISLNQSGNIYVSDATRNEIIKLDSLGNVLKSIGGYGWESSLFDNPSDIFSNILQVFVADKNNNRIQIFDKDLNFISQLSNSNNTQNGFMYPTSISVSHQGDIYILDSENKKVIKYNSKGNFISVIGSFDSGAYMLKNPIKIFFDENNYLIVLEPNQIIIFDQFGLGIGKIALSFDATNINMFSKDALLVNNNKSLFLVNNYLSKGNTEIKNINLPFENGIVDLSIYQNTIYFLTNSSIQVFEIK